MNIKLVNPERKNRVKKEYLAPEAEKIQFDYTEAVVASGLGDSRHDAAPGPGVFHVCGACWEYDSWIDSTGKCKGHY